MNKWRVGLKWLVAKGYLLIFANRPFLSWLIWLMMRLRGEHDGWCDGWLDGVVSCEVVPGICRAGRKVSRWRRVLVNAGPVAWWRTGVGRVEVVGARGGSHGLEGRKFAGADPVGQRRRGRGSCEHKVQIYNHVNQYHLTQRFFNCRCGIWPSWEEPFSSLSVAEPPSSSYHRFSSLLQLLLLLLMRVLVVLLIPPPPPIVIMRWWSLLVNDLRLEPVP